MFLTVTNYTLTFDSNFIFEKDDKLWTLNIFFFQKMV